MNVKCSKSCLANWNGLCVVDQCQGELETFYKPESDEVAKRVYEAVSKLFNEDTDTEEKICETP